MRAFALLLLSLAAFAVPAAAQEIPGRVGRIAWIEGGVAIYQDPDRGWEDAYVNWPITSENSVWTEPDARAEVQVAAIALRMDGASQLDVSRLDDNTLDATLERGSVAVRIRHLRPGELVRVSTPQASFLLQAAGRYRLDADPDRGESRLSVFAGAARMETASGRVPVPPGESVVVWGEDRPAYAFQDAYLTDFDRWAMARDERWVERRAPEYVSYEMTGYEDLDAYGQWSQDPVYGAVWFPTRVAEDWAPYRYGRWTYVQPWGWTWVDAEPWGYAPFHYGRWVHLRDRWAWCPGKRVDRPVWAPALVGFIGGAGWSASVTAGGPVVGWYPLAPSEPYRPWYRASRQYEQRVNVTIVRVPERVEREHREWNRDRAATVVQRQALVDRRPVAQARVQVPALAVRSAPVISAPANVLPNRNEVREANRREQTQRGARVAPPAAPAAPGAPSPIARPNASAPPAGGPANPAARPSFAKPRVAPRAAPKEATPPPPVSSPTARTPLPPAARGAPAAQPGAAKPAPKAQEGRPENGARARDREHGNATQDRAAADAERAKAAREAEQNRAKAEQDRAKAAQERAKTEQDRAKAEREAGQNRAKAEQDRAKAAREAEQDRAKAAREAEQNRAKAEQDRAKAEREAGQNRAKAEQDRGKAAREAEQNRAKASREAEQNRAKAERDAQQAREAQSRAAQQAQERAAREAQLRAAQEAAQRKAAEAQQKAAEQAQQRAAQQAAQQAAQRKAAEAQQKAAPQPPQNGTQKAQPAQDKARGAAPRRVPPEERGKDKEKDKGRGEGG